MIDLYSPVPQPWGEVIIFMSLLVIMGVALAEIFRTDKQGYKSFDEWYNNNPRKAHYYLGAIAGLVLIMLLSFFPHAPQAANQYVNNITGLTNNSTFLNIRLPSAP